MYKLLNRPFIYNILQRTASIGRIKAIKFLEDKISEEAHGRVCDIGCGTGRYAPYAGGQYYGIDIDIKYLIAAKQKQEYYICCDGSFLPFKENVFNFVFSVGFFHHINNDQTEKTLIEIKRIINRKSKVLIIDIFYPNNIFNFLGYLLCSFDRGRYVRRDNDFCALLMKDFNIVEHSYIRRSFPQNMRYFILESK